MDLSPQPIQREPGKRAYFSYLFGHLSRHALTHLIVLGPVLLLISVAGAIMTAGEAGRMFAGFSAEFAGGVLIFAVAIAFFIESALIGGLFDLERQGISRPGWRVLARRLRQQFPTSVILLLLGLLVLAGVLFAATFLGITSIASLSQMLEQPLMLLVIPGFLFFLILFAFNLVLFSVKLVEGDSIVASIRRALTLLPGQWAVSIFWGLIMLALLGGVAYGGYALLNELFPVDTAPNMGLQFLYFAFLSFILWLSLLLFWIGMDLHYVDLYRRNADGSSFLDAKFSLEEGEARTFISYKRVQLVIIRLILFIIYGFGIPIALDITLGQIPALVSIGVILGYFLLRSRMRKVRSSEGFDVWQRRELIVLIAPILLLLALLIGYILYLGVSTIEWSLSLDMLASLLPLLLGLIIVGLILLLFRMALRNSFFTLKITSEAISWYRGPVPWLGWLMGQKRLAADAVNRVYLQKEPWIKPRQHRRPGNNPMQMLYEDKEFEKLMALGAHFAQGIYLHPILIETDKKSYSLLRIQSVKDGDQTLEAIRNRLNLKATYVPGEFVPEENERFDSAQASEETFTAPIP